MGERPEVLSIGDVARRTRVKVPTIRYYEQIGLLPAPSRSDGNRRYYTEDATRRLTFVRHARELGFEIEAIRALLALQDEPDRPCNDIDALAREHLAAIEQKIERLTALRREMKRMLKSCSGGRAAECRVIEAIGKSPD
ncbi:MerR family transcriptional regulator [Bradyrhizobium sp. AZCC 2289]|uniref:MerR family transcriptional regulator n=1 Tax=Bradyrhizobium sp. AZCC 2289 TaxID=3117026 RepID=UPI002FF3F39F